MDPNKTGGKVVARIDILPEVKGSLLIECPFCRRGQLEFAVSGSSEAIGQVCRVCSRPSIILIGAKR